MRIALYGGSFNPPHLGHVEAARTVAEALKPDRFLILPANMPPHKELEPGSPDGQQRLELCRMAFRDVPKAEVSDWEILREGKSYTADTVEALRKIYPEDEIFLTLGADMFLCLEQWYRFEYLVEQCTLAVFCREGGEEEALRRCGEGLERRWGARWLLLPHEPLPMSSGEIRHRLKFRLGADALDDAVYGCIVKNGYYDALPELSWLREKAYAWLDPGRIAHVAGCESEAVLLAKRWGEDPELAAEAGILHDITKKLSWEEQLNLCEKYGIINDQAEKNTPSILHAKTGAALAKDLFGVEERVYEAIRWHCTGKPDMSLLEKIVWLADYSEPTRDFPGVEKIRELAYEDIDEAMAEALNMTLQHIRSKGREPYKDTAEAYQWYCREKET